MSRRLLALLVPVLLLVAACGPQAAEEPAAPTLEPDGVYRVEVLMRDMHFDPAEIVVPDGARLVVELRNTDGMPHDLVLETGEASALLARGERATIDVGPVTDDIDGWCSVTGHRESGMILTISPAP